MNWIKIKKRLMDLRAQIFKLTFFFFLFCCRSYQEESSNDEQLNPSWIFFIFVSSSFLFCRVSLSLSPYFCCIASFSLLLFELDEVKFGYRERGFYLSYYLRCVRARVCLWFVIGNLGLNKYIIFCFYCAYYEF